MASRLDRYDVAMAARAGEFDVDSCCVIFWFELLVGPKLARDGYFGAG